METAVWKAFEADKDRFRPSVWLAVGHIREGLPDLDSGLLASDQVDDRGARIGDFAIDGERAGYGRGSAVSQKKRLHVGLT